MLNWLGSYSTVLQRQVMSMAGVPVHSLSQAHMHEDTGQLPWKLISMEKVASHRGYEPTKKQNFWFCSPCTMTSYKPLFLSKFSWLLECFFLQDSGPLVTRAVLSMYQCTSVQSPLISLRCWALSPLTAFAGAQSLLRVRTHVKIIFDCMRTSWCKAMRVCAGILVVQFRTLWGNRDWLAIDTFSLSSPKSINEVGSTETKYLQ